LIDRIYHIALEITDAADKVRYASYLDLHLEIDSDFLNRVATAYGICISQHNFVFYLRKN
jgi:hypothetical protein